MNRICTSIICIIVFSGIIGCNAAQSDLPGVAPDINFVPTIEVVDSTEKLTDNIVFVEQRSQPNYRIAQFDPLTQEISTLFQIPKNAWVYQMDVSPDGTQIALAYSAPPQGDQSLLDRSGIYLLDLTSEAAQPERLVGGQQIDVYYTYPAWTSDGKYLYYEVSSKENSTYHIERFSIESGETTLIAENAILPQASPDGKYLTYFKVQSDSQLRALMMSEADGNNVQQMIPGYAYYDLDCPVFSPDGKWIHFTVLEDPLATVSWLDQILGTQVAFAHVRHDLPADWWQISVSDVRPEQVTAQSIITQCGQFSSDGTHFGFASNEGMYVLADGESEAQLILKSRAIAVFDWMP